MAGASLETRYTASAPPPFNFPRDIHWSPRALGYTRRLHSDIASAQAPGSPPKANVVVPPGHEGAAEQQGLACVPLRAHPANILAARRGEWFGLADSRCRLSLCHRIRKNNCLLFSPQSYLTRVDRRFETDLAMRFLEVSDQWLAPNLSFQVLIPRPFTCTNMRMPLQVR